MRTTILLALLVACGPKEAPEPAPVAAAESTSAAPAESETDEEADAEAAEASAEPVEAPSNADLRVTITHADGTTQSGHVKRIERSSDWFADEGWDDEPGKLKMDGESPSSFKDIHLDPSLSTNVDCYYDSNWSPWMYDCTVDTTSTAVLKDGSKWTVTNRHKWKFIFDDGTQVEFWLKKHPAREQDSEKVDLDTVDPQNYDLYTSLQERLKSELKSSIVVKVTVQ